MLHANPIVGSDDLALDPAGTGLALRARDNHKSRACDPADVERGKKMHLAFALSFDDLGRRWRVPGSCTGAICCGSEEEAARITSRSSL